MKWLEGRDTVSMKKNKQVIDGYYKHPYFHSLNF